MNTHTINIMGAQLLCKYVYRPGEPQTRDCPGEEEGVEILGIEVAGEDVDFEHLFSSRAITEIEAKLLVKAHEDRDQTAIDRYLAGL